MTIAALRWFKAALVLQILLVGYWLAIETIPLFPWNDLAARPPGYDLRFAIETNALPLIVCALIFAFGSRPLAMLSALGYAAYLSWQLWIWWKPFVMGNDIAWQTRYTTEFARTLKAIPPIGVHLAPDAQNLTLQALALVTLIVTLIAIGHMRNL